MKCIVLLFVERSYVVQPIFFICDLRLHLSLSESVHADCAVNVAIAREHPCSTGMPA